MLFLTVFIKELLLLVHAALMYLHSTYQFRLIPSFLEGSETLFIGQGTDIAFVDFATLKNGAIAVNSDRTSVTVTLPKPQLEPAVLNVSQSYVYAQ